MTRDLFLRFNPWSEEYKTPFGAVPLEKEVTFSLKAVGEIDSISLLVYYGDEKQEVLMKKTDRYTCSFTPQKKGLYFYYFKICTHDQIFYFNKSVENQLTTNKDEVQAYQLTCYHGEEKAPDWYKNGIVYQIFPDRFFEKRDPGLPTRQNSFYYLNKEDTPVYVRNEEKEVIRWDFYGGNLAGILEKLDYLKSLGITVIYLNPIFEARSNHRYDTADYLKIDSFLGDNDFFRYFMEQMHQKGFRVILDGVFNHVGRVSRYFNHDGRYGDEGAYQSQDSPYSSWFVFDDYPDDYRSWWGVKDLPEVNKENPDYQNFIYGENGVIDYWSDYQVDGWRLDVADELPDFFIEGIRQRLDQKPDKVLIGEVWEDASNKISYGNRREYILGGSLHGVMNYPLKEAIMALTKQRTTPKNIANQLLMLLENYPREVFYSNLNHLSTHDTKRILTELHESKEQLEIMLAMTLCLPGVPSIYYGDEAGVTGWTDPDNRKYFPWGRENHEITAIYQKWLEIRQKDTALTDGELYLGYNQEALLIVRENQQQIAVLGVHQRTTDFTWKQFYFPRPLPKRVQDKLQAENFAVSAVPLTYQCFDL